MIHEIRIRVVDEGEEYHIEISTPPTLSSVEVVGYLEMAKKQYIESRHATGPTVYQTPTLNHDNSDRWTGGDRKDAE